jgi:hypothetical protein
MYKLTLVALLTIYTSIGYGQSDFFVLKKNNKTIARFFKGSYIAFQVNKQQWQTGYITRLRNDSFWIRPMVVYFGLMNTDTVHLNVITFALSDVYAMPKKGIQVDYIKGRFQITKTGGHVHWYWVKSGWLFRVGGAGYAGLSVVNGLLNDDFSFSKRKNEIGIAAGVFLFGVLLKKTYKPTLQMGSRYHLEYINLPVRKN